MKIIVVVVQQENWEDDGGDHDPNIFEVDDADFDWVAKLHDKVTSGDMVDKFYTAARQIPVGIFPMQIDGVFNIWWR
jgi:hypothetical protein